MLKRTLTYLTGALALGIGLTLAAAPPEATPQPEKERVTWIHRSREVRGGRR